MIRVTLIASACALIETPDLRLLTDPWFTPGAYDGAWFPDPPPQDVARRIGAVDAIWVSHLHPDHYDPTWLRDYLLEHPGTRLLIGQFPRPYLHQVMRRDGFEPEVSARFTVGGTTLAIVPHETGSCGDIDSALAVRHGSHAVVNLNDCPVDAEQIAALRAFCQGEVTLGLLGYTGAGPYPQTYYTDPATLVEKAEAKRLDFLGRYAQAREALKPRRALPFAGQYLLGSTLWHLNPFRGQADAVDVRAVDPEAAVPVEGASIDTRDLVTEERVTAHDPIATMRRAFRLADRPLAYHGDPEPASRALLALIQAAYPRALEHSEATADHWFCLELDGAWVAMNANPERRELGVYRSVDCLEPRSEITVDRRHLAGLLTGRYHWNTAEVGSHILTRRVPDVFDRATQGFLSFLRA